MGNSKLPPKDSPELQEYWKRVKSGEFDAVCRELGYAERQTLLRGLRRRGFDTDEIPITWDGPLEPGSG